jgi:hypothetical protein
MGQLTPPYKDPACSGVGTVLRDSKGRGQKSNGIPSTLGLNAKEFRLGL